MSNEFLEEKIGYRFKSAKLLETALSHSSYAAEHCDIQKNERLEFLGDAVLATVVSEELYKVAPEFSEGKLSVVRAYLVREESLAKIAEVLDLGSHINLGIGEQKNLGNQKPSILADAVEALIGAVFLDSDYEVAKSLILRLWGDRIKNAAHEKDFGDYKSKFQMRMQRNGEVCIEYKLDASEGRPDKMKFFVSLYVNGKKMSEGVGYRKKEAEQAAAKAALERISHNVF